MKRIVFETALVCIVVVLLGMHFFSGPSRAKAAERVEYKTEASDAASSVLEPTLNRYARDGWELVAVVTPTNSHSTLIFKRTR
jgi:hypothetical protein